MMIHPINVLFTDEIKILQLRNQEKSTHGKILSFDRVSQFWTVLYIFQVTVFSSFSRCSLITKLSTGDKLESLALMPHIIYQQCKNHEEYTKESWRNTSGCPTCLHSYRPAVLQVWSMYPWGTLRLT